MSVSPHPIPASAAADPEARPDDAVEVGRVLGPWGVKGGLKVKPFASDPQALFSSKRWFLEAAEVVVQRPAGVRVALPLPRLLRVVQAREQGDAVVATVQEVTDRDAAQALTGARVFVSRASFPTPDKDEFYWVDLIGLDVVNRDGVALGTVTGLIETGPHCVLRLRPPEEDAPVNVALPLGSNPAGGGRRRPASGLSEERLIPFVDAYVDRVDLSGRTIHVDWAADF